MSMVSWSKCDWEHCGKTMCNRFSLVGKNRGTSSSSALTVLNSSRLLDSTVWTTCFHLIFALPSLSPSWSFLSIRYLGEDELPPASCLGVVWGGEGWGKGGGEGQFAIYLQSYLQSEGAMNDEGLFRDGGSWERERELRHEEHKQQLKDKACLVNVCRVLQLCLFFFRRVCVRFNR